METETEVAAVVVTTGMKEVVETAETVKEVTESSTDWEVEQIKGTVSEETLLTMVELGMEVTAESI
jgi:hypothetical protein